MLEHWGDRQARAGVTLAGNRVSAARNAAPALEAVSAKQEACTFSLGNEQSGELGRARWAQDENLQHLTM